MRKVRIWGRGVSMVRRVSAFQVLALVTLSACSGSTGTEEGQTSLPVGPGYYSRRAVVCDLLGSSDLEPVLGRSYSVGPDKQTNALAGITGITKCIYNPAGYAGGADPAIVTSGIVYAYASQIFEEVRDRRKTLHPEMVRGLGSRAFWTPAAGELLVLAEGKIFGFTVHGDGTEPDYAVKERARRLAGSVLPRLRSSPTPR